MNTTANEGPGPVVDPLIPFRDRAAELGTHLSRAVITKGVLALVFGVVLLAWPSVTLLVTLWTFAVYALVDGVSTLWTTWTSGPRDQRFAGTVQGLAGIAAGVVAIAWPGITSLALLFLIAAWAMVKGVAEIVAAFAGDGLGTSTRILLGLAGVVAMLFGVAIAVHPAAGAVALVGLIGALALVTGATFVAAGIALRVRD
ncbi:HdeD family acid-resistance protein [Pseudonocardia ailaonensis]|uniref:HdeD family acid-resistance protein n=1 Tax=Pseudonocardia ailaonensis TaxID=367279 RepID=A0ABN2NKY1_9PSEU